ncbi:hypothetical protein [Halocatena halophila]|uniref:hypothetical protein n=1 Tax=Halocatena halophila TaxID=2814576 RepID=UPI002ED2FBAC
MALQTTTYVIGLMFVTVVLLALGVYTVSTPMVVSHQPSVAAAVVLVSLFVGFDLRRQVD